MQTYQVRARVFVSKDPGGRLSFPNDCEARFMLEPAAAFGGGSGPSRTATKDATATIRWDANTDRDDVVSSRPLDPVNLEIASEQRMVVFHGNQVVVRCRLYSVGELTALLERVSYRLPLALNVDFVDAPVIAQITCRVGPWEFVWQYAHRDSHFDVVDTQKQESRLREAWARMDLLRSPERRSLLAALHWFHVACRLERAGHTPWEFMAEVLLNYCKVLEVLFPGEENRTIDASRVGLASLGYSSQEIESWFVPTIALRNKVDVAHVSLAELNPSQLKVLHDYTEGAEGHFRELLVRVFNQIADGAFQLPPYRHEGPKRQVVQIVDRMMRSPGPS